MSEAGPRPSQQLSAALEELLTRFGGLVRGIGGRHGLTESEVDEVVQDVRIRIWRARVQPEQISAVTSSYVYRTAVTAALDLIRRRRTRPAQPLEGREVAAVGDSRDPKRDLENAELSHAIFTAVDALPEARRAVVRMHLTGYHRDEIAALLGWSEARTRNLLYRGLAMLREELVKRGIAPERA